MSSTTITDYIRKDKAAASPRKSARRGTPTKGLSRSDNLKILIGEIKEAMKLLPAPKKRRRRRGPTPRGPKPPLHGPYKKPYTPVMVAADNDTLPADPNHPAVVHAARVANDVAAQLENKVEQERKNARVTTVVRDVIQHVLPQVKTYYPHYIHVCCYPGK
jgi:hypothetical protein